MSGSYNSTQIYLTLKPIVCSWHYSAFCNSHQKQADSHGCKNRELFRKEAKEKQTLKLCNMGLHGADREKLCQSAILKVLKIQLQSNIWWPCAKDLFKSLMMGPPGWETWLKQHFQNRVYIVRKVVMRQIR